MNSDTTMIVEVPADVKREFKLACAMREESMRDALIRLMKGSAQTIVRRYGRK